MEQYSYLVIFLIFNIYVASAGGTPSPREFSGNLSDYNKNETVSLVINKAKNLPEEAEKYAALKSRSVSPMDCAEILNANATAQSGIYRIWPRSRAVEGFIEVYCDMDDDGGAWTVIQRRGNFDSGKDYFFRDWNDYKKGFGHLQKDFWLGNDIIFALTNQDCNTVKFVLTDWEEFTSYATYDDFWIDDERNKYAVHASGYRGTAGGAFSYHDGFAFSTRDQDNDNNGYKHCAEEFKGAWWYNECFESNLNGFYYNRSDKNTKGIVWNTFREDSLKDTVIKIRPKHLKKNVLPVIPNLTVLCSGTPVQKKFPL